MILWLGLVHTWSPLLERGRKVIHQVRKHFEKRTSRPDYERKRKRMLMLMLMLMRCDVDGGLDYVRPSG